MRSNLSQKEEPQTTKQRGSGGLRRLWKVRPPTWKESGDKAQQRGPCFSPGEEEERGKRERKGEEGRGEKGNKNESCFQWVLYRRTERNHITGKEEVKCLSPDFTSMVPFSVKMPISGKRV